MVTSKLHGLVLNQTKEEGSGQLGMQDMYVSYQCSKVSHSGNF